MIWVYTGTPGSGKSLHCAQDILFKINRGQRVIANFPINEEYIKKKFRHNFLYLPDSELTPHYLFEFAKAFHKEKKEGQTLLFIDEAQRIFPIDRTYTLKKDWEHFFQLHRHYGYNIILCTQQISYINKGIRIQAEYEVKHRKINNYKFFGWLLGRLCGGALFTALEYWVGARQCTNQIWFTYKKKYGRLYDTFGNFKTNYNEQQITDDFVTNDIVTNDNITDVIQSDNKSNKLDTKIIDISQDSDFTVSYLWDNEIPDDKMLLLNIST